eukprot:TRINITY_DN1087_c0_g1_i3.p1 TRINITY_DN1087_c0_g1~~TRINITY_DN1087_c0_g1_i3.p1  ORF type:complete len:364 (-),score=87.39 TRINITY_DN1087_c0_g1_i3:114-1205(-)
MSINVKELEIIKSWGTSVLVGVDIGATNTRVVVSRGASSEYEVLMKFPCSSVSLLCAGLDAASAALSGAGVVIAGAALDAAGPVTSDASGAQCVVITNWAGLPQQRTLTAAMLPPALFPPHHSSMLNDLEAGCFGLLALNAQNKINNTFTTLWGKKEESLAPCHHLILAMGTGLGVGALIHHGKQFTVLPMEVGHTLIYPYGPRHKNAKDDESLCAFASETLYEGVHGVEFEDICSGRGLVLAYRWVLKKEGKDSTISITAEEVSQLANKGDKEATRAMLEHYRMLIRTAQNMCVALQAKGVILSGDNQVHNKDFVLSHIAELQEEFLQHPKRHWLENTPVLAQVSHCNTMALGCIFKASEMI